jgi:lipoate-protein ligase A
VSHTGGWLIERRSGSARELHLAWPEAGHEGGRVLTRCEVTGGPALVLGSSQEDGVVDADAVRRAGVDVVHRRSGGGAVMVAPGAQLWLEAWVPRSDALWDDDVVRGAFWFGELWATALATLGADPVVHRARATVTDWSALVCFAGIGPGEVTVATKKVVGLSQRRTAAGARLQTVAALRWDPRQLLELFDLPAADRGRAEADLAHRAQGLSALGSAVGGDAALSSRIEAVWAAVVDNLPRP